MLTPGAEAFIPDGAVILAMPGHPTRLLPRVVLSTLVGAMLVAAVGSPAQAQAGGAVPNPGARPTPDGQVSMPGGGSTITAPPGSTATVLGPLAAEIAAKEIEVNTVEQQLQALQPQLAPAGTAAELAEEEWLAKSEALTEAEQALDELVGDSYRGAAALPPDLFLPQLPGLSAHNPSLPVDVPTGTEAAALEYVRARDEAQVAREQYELATTTEQTLEEQAEDLEDRLADLQAELDELLDDNLELLVEEERDRERRQQANADDYLSNQPVNGFAPHPSAVRAVEFALDQLGDRYVWGAEGPDQYDCSGLTWRSYRSVGATLPRVANDQFWGTRNRLVTMSAAVAQRGLLPGDLVFFGRGSWQAIHHVGMYVGNGLMVHAPNSREVVKVSPIWWPEFFAATRVFPARPVGNDPSQPPTTGPDPDPPTSRPPTTRPPTSEPPDDPTTNPPTSQPPTSEPPDETEPPDSTTPPADETEEPQEPTEPPTDEQPTETPASESPASETPIADSTPSPGPS